MMYLKTACCSRRFFTRNHTWMEPWLHSGKREDKKLENVVVSMRITHIQSAMIYFVKVLLLLFSPLTSLSKSLLSKTWNTDNTKTVQ